MAVLDDMEIRKVSLMRKKLSGFGITGDEFSSERLQAVAIDMSDRIMDILGYRYEPDYMMYRRKDEDNSGKHQRRDGG